MQPTDVVDRMEDADLVVFTGGEDVFPHLYGEKPHPSTMANPRRDFREKNEFEKARDLNLRMWGTCRGSQFLCVMAGGRLVQDQDNPAFLHDMKTFDGKEIEVTSTHHQAAYPWDLKEGSDFHLLGWTTDMSATHQNGDGKEIVVGVVAGDREVEMVWYPQIRALGCQSHAEMVYGERGYEEYISYMQSLLDDFMNGSLEQRIRDVAPKQIALPQPA
jgi:gamma-glutamyl-gamma-aminobutyrate hydrolase PuuD